MKSLPINSIYDQVISVTSGLINSREFSDALVGKSNPNSIDIMGALNELPLMRNAKTAADQFAKNFTNISDTVCHINLIKNQFFLLDRKITEYKYYIGIIKEFNGASATLIKKVVLSEVIKLFREAIYKNLGSGFCVAFMLSIPYISNKILNQQSKNTI